MIRKALSVHPMEHNVAVAKKFLRHHRRLVEIAGLRSQLRVYNVLSKVRLAAAKRVELASLFWLRVQLASIAALSDLLVWSLCVVTLFFVYQMYRLCRTGLTKAEEKYQTLAIPIIQTIEALEMNEQLRRERDKARREMDADIVRQRK